MLGEEILIFQLKQKQNQRRKWREKEKKQILDLHISNVQKMALGKRKNNFKNKLKSYKFCADFQVDL